MKKYMSAILITLCCLCFTIHNYESLKVQAATDTCVKYYTSIEIQPGDTLSGICAEQYHQDNTAHHYKSTKALMKEVCRINNLNDPDQIGMWHYIVVPYYK